MFKATRDRSQKPRHPAPIPSTMSWGDHRAKTRSHTLAQGLSQGNVPGKHLGPYQMLLPRQWAGVEPGESVFLANPRCCWSDASRSLRFKMVQGPAASASASPGRCLLLKTQSCFGSTCITGALVKNRVWAPPPDFLDQNLHLNQSSPPPPPRESQTQ